MGNDGFWGFVTALVLCAVTVVIARVERKQANTACQKLGYSAGHYEKEAGLVCEQWIEATKVKP